MRYVVGMWLVVCCLIIVSMVVILLGNRCVLRNGLSVLSGKLSVCSMR